MKVIYVGPNHNQGEGELNNVLGVPLSFTFYWQVMPLSHTVPVDLESRIPFNFCKYTVFYECKYE